MAHRPLSVPLVPGTYLPGYECSVINGSVKGGLSHRGVALSSGSGDAESPAVRQICRLSPSSLARAESPRQSRQPRSFPPLHTEGGRTRLCLRGLLRRQPGPSCLLRFDFSSLRPGLAIEQLSKHLTRQCSPNLLKLAQLGPCGCTRSGKLSLCTKPLPPRSFLGEEGLWAEPTRQRLIRELLARVTAPFFGPASHPSAPS